MHLNQEEKKKKTYVVVLAPRLKPSVICDFAMVQLS